MRINWNKMRLRLIRRIHTVGLLSACDIMTKLYLPVVVYQQSGSYLPGKDAFNRQ